MKGRENLGRGGKVAEETNIDLNNGAGTKVAGEKEYEEEEGAEEVEE